VKANQKEIFRLQPLHTLQPNIAQAQKPIIIPSLLCAQQQQQPQQLHLTQLLNIVQAQKPIIIRSLLCAQQP
jgi:hypothetical protein